MCRRFENRAKQAWIKGLVGLVLVVASLALAQTPIPDGAARVRNLTGLVSVVRGADLWAVNLHDTVTPGQEIVTGPDGYAELELQDGSHFEVFADSHVVFRANRGSMRELLDVVLGKVKVHIQKLGGRPNPYRVNSPTALIAVRGTTFEVEVESADSTVVSVVEGVVEVSHKLKPGKPAVLTDGEKIRVLASEPLANSVNNRMYVFKQVLENVADRAISVIRSGGIGGGSRGGVPAPGGTTTTGGGVPVPGTTSGDGKPLPPSGGRPGGDTGDGDTAPGTPKPPSTGGTPSTPTPTPTPTKPKGPGDP